SECAGSVWYVARECRCPAWRPALARLEHRIVFFRWRFRYAVYFPTILLDAVGTWTVAVKLDSKRQIVGVKLDGLVAGVREGQLELHRNGTVRGVRIHPCFSLVRTQRQFQPLACFGLRGRNLAAHELLYLGHLP